MAAITDADISIAVSGDIRWTGAATANRHTVLEFIQWLMLKQDDEQASGDDLLDITTETPFDRSTDQIVSLNYPFNIDDTFALHLYDGSVSQTDDTNNPDNTLYSGLRLIGPVETGTQYMIIQNGKVLPAFWGTGINGEAVPSLIFSQHLVKSRNRGADIDGKRITVLARELGDSYRRFPVTLGTGNAVAAIGNGVDIFNTTVDADLGDFEANITNTLEGFQELDIDKTGATGQEFYSQWTKGTRTINETYEYTKWISQRSHVADSNAESGDDYIVDNNTAMFGRGSEFSATPESEVLTGLTVSLKIGAGTPTGYLDIEIYDSDEASPAAPTGTILGRSERVLASQITTSYEDVLFQFNRYTPLDGTDQLSGLTLVADQEYFFVVHHEAGGSADYIEVQGDATSGDDGNICLENPADTFVGTTTQALQFSIRTSPLIHGMAGDRFEGISVDVGFDGETGTGPQEGEFAFWGTNITYDGQSGTMRPGEHVYILRAGVEQSGGTVLYDDETANLIVALENPEAGIIADGDVITGIDSGAIRVMNTTVADEDLGGGVGLVLAKDDNGVDGELYMQLISGVNPVSNSVLYSTGTPFSNYSDATVTIETRTLIPEFVGTSTGSNIIGAYGIGFDVDDVGSSDRFTSLDNGSSVPPNNVVFTVAGLIAGEDRVLVGPRTGTALDTGQWLVSTALVLATETALIVKTGTDTAGPFDPLVENWPNAGIGANVSRLRIQRADGIYANVPYDSHDSSDTFTLGTPVSVAATIDTNNGAASILRDTGSFITDGFQRGCTFNLANTISSDGSYTVLSVSSDGLTIIVDDATGLATESGTGDETCTSTGWDFLTADSKNAAVNNDVFLAFIDILATATSESFTGVHDTTDRDLFVRVRDGGTAGDAEPTKTFESTSAQFKSTAQTVAAIRTPDA